MAIPALHIEVTRQSSRPMPLLCDIWVAHQSSRPLLLFLRMSVATQSHVVVIIFRWVVAALLIVLTRAVVVSSKLSVPRLLRWNLIVIRWIGIVVSSRRSVSACLRADWTAVDHVACRSMLHIGCRLAPETHQMSWSSRRRFGLSPFWP